jgi:cysteine desulfurase/selenocysteine lyase
MSFDRSDIRRAFPALDQQVHGKPLVYLDNAASSQMCLAAIEAVDHYHRFDRANVHRGAHELGRRATEGLEAARAAVAAFVNAPSTDEVVFVRGATEALNLVASSFGADFRPGDEIVLTAMEHHSNIVPWQLLAARTGAVIRVAPVHEDGSLDMAGLTALLGPRTRIVAMVHVSNTLGTINPVAAVARAAHEVGAKILVDGAQAAPHLPIDVQALDVDFYAFSGHKVYGPNGVGVLWGRRALLAAMPPWQGGGDMIRSVAFEGSTWAEPPARFEAGTPNVGGIIGLGAAVAWFQAFGRERAAELEHELAVRARAGLIGLPGVRLVGDAPAKTAVFSLVLEGAPHGDVGTLLDARGIAVRTGHHCTEPLMRRFGVSGTVRASFAFYNTPAEVDALLDGLERVRRILG